MNFMKRLGDVIIDWIDVNKQRKHKNSLVFLAMSFYLTLKGAMDSWLFIGVGLASLGIYSLANIYEHRAINGEDKGGENGR